MKQQILYALEQPENDKEEKASYILSSGNLSHIRNQLALEVQRRLNINPPIDENGYKAFIQEEAEIKGAMRAYQHLLDCHVDTVESFNHPQAPSQS